MKITLEKNEKTFEVLIVKSLEEIPNGKCFVIGEYFTMPRYNGVSVEYPIVYAKKDNWAYYSIQMRREKGWEETEMFEDKSVVDSFSDMGDFVVFDAKQRGLFKEFEMYNKWFLKEASSDN